MFFTVIFISLKTYKQKLVNIFMKIYLNKPTNKSYINFKAIKKNSYGFNCILTDYDLDAFLPINLVSNKKN